MIRDAAAAAVYFQRFSLITASHFLRSPRPYFDMRASSLPRSAAFQPRAAVLPCRRRFQPAIHAEDAGDYGQLPPSLPAFQR